MVKQVHIMSSGVRVLGHESCGKSYNVGPVVTVSLSTLWKRFMLRALVI
jgi:hypothetical protein